jgi:hypothetical protein
MLDLFSGKFGWSKSFALRQWECVGVDLVRPSEIPKGCDFINMDILGLESISEIAGPMFDFICASSPCNEFSVHAMRHFHPNPPYPESGIRLFEHTRRICEASGVPYVMENVRAAQQFVGNAVHHCGPFYLWGTGVPPLMPKGITKGTHDIKGVAVNQSKRYFRGAGERWQQASQVWSGSKARKEYTAELATIPPELANCVAQYAERVIEQRAMAR